MRLRLPCLLLSLLLSFALGAGGACKLESEPDWPYGPPPGGLPDLGGAPVGGADVVGGAADRGDVASPQVDDGVSGADAAPGPGPDGAATPEDAAGDALEADAGPGTPTPVTLTEEMQVALRRPVSAADREAAERDTESGRALHARLQLREALGHFRLALERMPSHPRANYFSARALALLGRHDEAVRHLLALEFLDTDAARELLREARGELDFRGLWPDPTWRRLTGFGTIGVAVAAGGAAPANESLGATRDAIVLRLTEAGLPAQAADDAGSGADDALAPVILYRVEHESLAQAVSGALAGTGLRRSADLPTDVLVLWRADAPLPASASVSLDALLDRRLQARDGYGLRVFRLRSTGFFEAEDRASDGAEVRRQRGRYRVDGDRLVLTYKETIERYPEGADVPEIETKEAARTVPFAVGPGRQVAIDGLAYRPQ